MGSGMQITVIYMRTKLEIEMQPGQQKINFIWYYMPAPEVPTRAQRFLNTPRLRTAAQKRAGQGCLERGPLDQGSVPKRLRDHWPQTTGLRMLQLDTVIKRALHLE